ncbi:MAG: 4-(cytidine 5'-diphospho)-2-C-methyl-D-erythritol kinase [Planctomycetaceae bacterium]|nr:4-(cytidine 5'-diphospho)-2-C-methyl-D-erythritol kinase [Planctomycetaceae bacterium]
MGRNNSTVQIQISTPAKVNLFFEVLGKRNDGFHEIVSVALPIRLFDRLRMKTAEDSRITFRCTGNSDDVPADENNIVVKTLQKIQERFSIRCGADVYLQKRIPSQAGLGGGSSDAAAAARTAVRAWNLTVTQEELAAILAEIGSDCPIFLYNMPSISTGRGEIIRPLPAIEPLWFVLWKPAEGLSTADVYRECMPLHNGDFRKPDALVAALAGGNVDAIGRELFNRLEVPARKLWKRFDFIKQRMTEAGCVAVKLCGSGTSFFGLCYNKESADEAAANLPPNEQIFVVRSAGRE